MEVIYLDTNIYLDYLLGRVSRTGRQIGHRSLTSNIIEARFPEKFG